jgi:hypothetical protein
MIQHSLIPTLELLTLVHNHIKNVDEEVALAARSVLSYIIANSIEERETLIDDPRLLPRIELLKSAVINDKLPEVEEEPTDEPPFEPMRA